MTRMELKGSNVLVVGMARSGLAAARLLVQHGAHVRATDAKPMESLHGVQQELASLDVPFILQSPAAFEACDLIVISPGVPMDLDLLEQARRRGTPVIGEVELAGWYLQGKTLGITGSNGKTTTTALAGHILRECGIAVQVGGNIGTAPTSMAGNSREGQWNVLELSSFQLETVDRFRAQIAVITNLTPDHLDRHHTMEAYVQAKGRLLVNQTAQDYAVLNADDATCAAFADSIRSRLVWFRGSRRTEAGWSFDGSVVFFEGKPWMEARGIPLRGRHNIENVMAAAGATHVAGAPLEQIAQAVRSFPGVEHRLEFTAEIGGVQFFNDSKATNVDATLKAIGAFDGGLWIILGGKDKGSDYTPLIEPLRRKAHAALLIGAAADKIASHLGNAVPVIRCRTLESAVHAAVERASAGDTVLLAPACASFDQFESFEHRGKVFKEIVHSLESAGVS
ncbi:MAG: UDP-N-acetylmuramoyl-L-alanine--D-glutamate ligase [Bryobacterales bacterium]|nr:UDP-N-acetylmuramoyl-L-alanine--D-glutamate ligase [Bryobacterales bacterium]MEB2360925.1 UDP-N-acetylmuramoyl-L-alanine--D-glutamate ligase [Bryobacterales bacterium]